MIRAALTLALLLLSACTVRAQDTFVPTGLKSSCEWWSGETCVRRRERVRPRIVVIPKTTYKPYRVVPEHLVPLRSSREAEVRGWRREWDRRGRDRHMRDGPRCWSVTYKAYSDEKIAKDAKLEAQRRWAGIVRSEIGERYMDWMKADNRREECWQSSTEERALDKATGTIKRTWRRVKDAVTGAERDEEVPEPTGSHERCMVEARPCRAERTKESEDD